MLAVTSTAEARPVPKLRIPGIRLDKNEIPNHWFGGNIFVTHFANGVCLLFPAGERFFIRAVNHYLEQIQDPHLRDQVRGFFGQEGRHAKEHDIFNRLLDEQGYPAERFLRLYEKLAYGVIEKLAGPKLSLATTVALEHFTAMLAEYVFKDSILDSAHPRMREFLSWHAAEEAEHRCVAYDVAQQVLPSYAWRIAGLGMATAMLWGWGVSGMVYLMAHDRELSFASLRAAFKPSRERSLIRRIIPTLVRGMGDYFRRDFHPAQNVELDAFAAKYLAEAGLT